MEIQLFHIFRNNPLGRETLLQSLYFCDKLGAFPCMYIPKHTKFLMYFDNDVVQVDLDNSYLTAPETAKQHALEISTLFGIKPRFFKPKNFTASALPDVTTNFEFMCCPRSISDLSLKIGLGYIGPRVRRIMRSAQFPVLLTSPVFKEWKSLTVFFGGSSNALQALKLGFRISRETGFPLDIFTQLNNGKNERAYRDIVQRNGLQEDCERFVRNWHFFEKGFFEENLYQVPHDCLVVVGAYGHGIIKDIIFGSKLEIIQSILPNTLLVVGPHYVASV